MVPMVPWYHGTMVYVYHMVPRHASCRQLVTARQDAETSSKRPLFLATLLADPPPTAARAARGAEWRPARGFDRWQHR
jgi:hypothetical protein